MADQDFETSPLAERRTAEEQARDRDLGCANLRADISQLHDVERVEPS